MQNLAYTNAEIRDIDEAARAVRYECERWDWSATPTLEAATKAFREGARRPVREARAHVCAAFLRGLNDGATITAADLCGFAEGFVKAVILGAGFAARRSTTPEEIASLRAKLEAADLAQAAALDRFLDRTRVTAAA